MLPWSHCGITMFNLPRFFCFFFFFFSSYYDDHTAAAAAKSLQSCPTLCDPMDCSLPSFSVHGILQARTLEWVAISFSNAWKWKVKVKLLSHIRLFATPWSAAYQAPTPMGFSRQEYWSGVPLPSPQIILAPNICYYLKERANYTTSISLPKYLIYYIYYFIY